MSVSPDELTALRRRWLVVAKRVADCCLARADALKAVAREGFARRYPDGDDDLARARKLDGAILDALLQLATLEAAAKGRLGITAVVTERLTYAQRTAVLLLLVAELDGIYAGRFGTLREVCAHSGGGDLGDIAEARAGFHSKTGALYRYVRLTPNGGNCGMARVSLKHGICDMLLGYEPDPAGNVGAVVKRWLDF